MEARFLGYRGYPLVVCISQTKNGAWDTVKKQDNKKKAI